MRQTQPDTLGRWLRDVFVTLVLLFMGIYVSGALTAMIAPQSAALYLVLLLSALIPTGIWLRRCNAAAFSTRAEFVAFFLSAVAFGLFIDFSPQVGQGRLSLGLMAIIFARPFVQRLVEKIPLLAGVNRGP